MTENRREGRILKGVGGFYEVETLQGMLTCKASGKLRKEQVKPYVGDLVDVQEQADGTGYIVSIAPRRNLCIRPPIANIDLLVIVASEAPPQTDLLFIDKLCVFALEKSINVLLLLNKSDVIESQTLQEIYQKAGIQTLAVSAQTGQGIEALRKQLIGKITAFAGNSGVGKSSLTNAIFEQTLVDVGELTQRITRGKHTTRHVELIPLGNGSYLADTPGFSSLEMDAICDSTEETLAEYFPEFTPLKHDCYFTGCTHTCEKGCAVLQAVQEGIITPSRHASYVALYAQMKGQKKWQKPRKRS